MTVLAFVVSAPSRIEEIDPLCRLVVNGVESAVPRDLVVHDEVELVLRAGAARPIAHEYVLRFGDPPATTGETVYRCARWGETYVVSTLDPPNLPTGYGR